jgi:L-alanine-DL-glutamate epimerase-like enolase superfamily enzyme
MTISAVTATRCVVPLARPLHLGSAVVTARDYIVVEVTTGDGVVGRAIGNARNAPIDALVRESIGPLVIGLDPLRTEQVWARMYYGCLPIGQRGGVMSAISLVDICCWDIKAQLAGLPLATLLGGYRDEVAVSIAGGYPELTPDPGSIGEAVAAYVAAGYRSIKLAADGSPADTARLAAARGASGDDVDLIVDVHWTWRDLQSAIRCTRGWEQFELTWLEDPFPARLAALVGPFRRAVPIPLGLGEDRAGIDDFTALLELDIDVLRIDATVCGGVTEFLRVAAVAAARGRSVSPHVFPEIHVHLAAALPNVIGVEMVDPSSGVTPIDRLLQPIDVRDGATAPPEAAGIGLTFDPDALQRYRSS